ncbi:unnamed protein product [Trichogramma brassicae]|uniref:Uncharacterized protein n=1 Tax=Trichogramma brassicae TaxID=86971 RepID=A0A6H5IXA8_9HYME|nr:unnamed protein product [Trichogramma brassicae]
MLDRLRCSTIIWPSSGRRWCTCRRAAALWPRLGDGLQCWCTRVLARASPTGRTVSRANFATSTQTYTQALLGELASRATFTSTCTHLIEKYKCKIYMNHQEQSFTRGCDGPIDDYTPTTLDLCSVYYDSINNLHGLREYPNTRSTADATIVALADASARTTHTHNDRRLGRPTHHTTSRSSPGPDPPVVVLVVCSAVGSTGSLSRTRVDSYRYSHSSLGRRRILLPVRYSSIRRRHPRGCRAQLTHSSSVRSQGKSSTPLSVHILTVHAKLVKFYVSVQQNKAFVRRLHLLRELLVLFCHRSLHRTLHESCTLHENPRVGSSGRADGNSCRAPDENPRVGSSSRADGNSCRAPDEDPRVGSSGRADGIRCRAPDEDPRVGSFGRANGMSSSEPGDAPLVSSSGRAEGKSCHCDSSQSLARPDEPTRGSSFGARHLIPSARPDEPTRGSSSGARQLLPSARPDEPTRGSSSARPDEPTRGSSFGARHLIPSARPDEPTRGSSSGARQLLPSARPDEPTRGSSSGAQQLLLSARRDEPT